jgi:hypothetical protein
VTFSIRGASNAGRAAAEALAPPIPPRIFDRKMEAGMLISNKFKLAAALCLLVPGSAMADDYVGPRPPGDIYIGQTGVADYYGCPGNPDNDCGVHTAYYQTGPKLGNQTVTATYGSANFYGNISAGSAPSVTLNMYASSGGASSADRWEATGEADAWYNYVIVDPYGSQLVPLIASYTLGHTALLSGAGASGSYNLYLAIQGDRTVSAYDGDGSALGSHIDDFTVTSNQSNFVFMQVDAYAGANDGWVWAAGHIGAGSASEMANIDPTITIDPTWLSQHPGVSIAFDTLALATPLPGALTLFGTALAGLGAFAFRRRAGKEA